MIIIKKAQVRIEDKIELLSALKTDLKESSIAKDICEEYGFDTSIIEGIPIEFSDELDDISAKTINSKILLNEKLIDMDYTSIMRYVIHEFTHAIQHMEKEGKPQEEHDGAYLENPDEIEAFQNQVEFERQEKGDSIAKEYVNKLLDFHKMKGEDRDNIKKQLLQ